MCHTGDKFTLFLVLFNDLSDLGEKKRVIKELFKVTNGSRVINDKRGYTGSPAIWFINFASYFVRAKCTKILWLMYDSE